MSWDVPVWLRWIIGFVRVLLAVALFYGVLAGGAWALHWFLRDVIGNL